MLKRLFTIFLILLLTLSLTTTVFAQDDEYDGDWGRDVECENGDEITGGIEVVIVQQRTGNQYRITAVGIDDFDPVIGVMLTGEYDDAICNDDSNDAEDYTADLPTTGEVDPSGLSSQVVLNLNTSNIFENVSIVVGGLGESSGEFILIVEGMYASSLDNAGDPMALTVSPALFASEIAPTVYMISVVGAFDPLVYLADSNLGSLEDEDGDPIICDDAGVSGLCWGESDSLGGSFISRSNNRLLGGGQFDSMLTIPLTEDELGSDLLYVMTSYGSTEGDYVVVFHLGIQGEDDTSEDDSSGDDI